ncbi:MAG TPA: AMP-binding protein, partial [Bacteroidia bacterium]|nr:AMP-binding protein [Bacteroidia bacterium]
MLDENNRTINYNELLICSSGFKSWLQSISPDLKNQPIAIWGDKNTALISFLFALLQTENGYLPINPEWPAERIKFIFKQVNLRGCIIENKYMVKATEVLTELNVEYQEFRINEDYTFIKANDIKITYPKNLAYILFTSGSMGFPKGIVHCADGMNAFLNWCKKEFTKYKVSRFVSIAPLNFDLSVFDLFFPVIAKKSLYLPEQSTISNTRHFAQYIFKNKIEAIYTTPSYLKLLIETGQLNKHNFSFMKLVLIAGEQLSYELAKELKKHFKKAAFYNLYGPTETNVCTHQKIDFSKIKSKDIVVPIGKACYAGSVKQNKSSELLYKGKLLMKAIIDENGIHVFKSRSSFNTGDKVKKLNNGNFEFIGRG